MMGSSSFVRLVSTLCLNLKKRYDTRKSGDEVKYSTKYSDAIHILAYIHLFKGTDLSSDRIAQSVETNPAYVRRIMSDLRIAGLIESQRGKTKP